MALSFSVSPCSKATVVDVLVDVIFGIDLVALQQRAYSCHSFVA